MDILMANELNEYNFGKIVSLVEVSIKNDNVIFNELKELKTMINSQNEAIANGRGIIAGLMGAAGLLGAAAVKIIEKVIT